MLTSATGKAIGRAFDADLRQITLVVGATHPNVEYKAQRGADHFAEKNPRRSDLAGDGDRPSFIEVLRLRATGLAPGAQQRTRLGCAQATLASELGREQVQHSFPQVV